MAGQSARREGVDSKVSGQPSDRYGCLAQFKAKTWHSFPCLLAIVSLFAVSLGRVPTGLSGLAVVYSRGGDGCGGEVILCLRRLNKELIVDKFRHFSSDVFGLSLCSSVSVCVCVSECLCVQFHFQLQRTCLTFNRNQFILCEIIVLMAACSPLFFSRLTFTFWASCFWVYSHTNPRGPTLRRSNTATRAVTGFGLVERLCEEGWK